MFFKAQGYELECNVLFQDNQSAIRIEKHVRGSMSANTTHVNNRYFWVKDRVDRGELQIMYCPTELMLADFLQNHYKETCFVV